MPHRESRFNVNLVIVIISERGGDHRAGFVVSYSTFLSQKQRAIIRDSCTKDVRPIDKVNITIESGRYTIYYVDFHLFPLFDNCTALREIAVLKRYD